MNGVQIQALVVETIKSPATAAQRLLSLKLPQNWLWMALVLMCVLNSIVYSVSLQIAPPVEGEAGMILIPRVFRSPVLFSIFLFGTLSLTVLVLYRLGRSMGGTAELVHILTLISWMQVLRLLLQVAVLVLSVIAPFLGALLVMVGSVWGIYILAVFLNAAHGFGSIIKAVGLMIFSFFAIAIGMSMLLGMMGGIV